MWHWCYHLGKSGNSGRASRLARDLRQKAVSQDRSRPQAEENVIGDFEFRIADFEFKKLKKQRTHRRDAEDAEFKYLFSNRETAIGEKTICKLKLENNIPLFIFNYVGQGT